GYRHERSILLAAVAIAAARIPLHIRARNRCFDRIRIGTKKEFYLLLTQAVFIRDQGLRNDTSTDHPVIDFLRLKHNVKREFKGPRILAPNEFCQFVKLGHAYISFGIATASTS